MANFNRDPRQDGAGDPGALSQVLSAASVEDRQAPILGHRGQFVEGIE